MTKRKAWGQKPFKPGRCLNCGRFFKRTNAQKNKTYCCKPCWLKGRKKNFPKSYRRKQHERKAIIKRKQTYCLQDHRQCVRYHCADIMDPFQDKLNCFGVKYYQEGKDCYVRPRI